MTARRTIIGVRHHSPACARLVAHVLEREKPDVVLIEGPSDMNGRLDEFALPHTLPIALFTWSQIPNGRVHGVWSPFCDTSPEWVGLQVGARVGAKVAFIDLPAWHDAFHGTSNRYSDRHLRASDRLSSLAQARGFDSVDALWDHLFEAPQDDATLEAKLHRYFEMLRGDEAPDEGDAAREAFMRSEIERHSTGAKHVVVICGGYHSNALREDSPVKLPAVPSVTVPEGVNVGSALVPFSFKRLDSFAGYASGMPSPAWYQCLFERGHHETPDVMLQTAVAKLRSKGQVVSVADVIAARTMMTGLATVRGHELPARLDVLDGLASALVKDALDAPLPWSRRGVLSSGTNPMLVELVAAFSGERLGALAAGTPLPPLVADAMAALDAHGLSLERNEKRFVCDLSEEAGRRRSQVLHRLALVGVVGVKLTRGANFSRHKTWLKEEWSLHRHLETDSSLVEASRFGGTLEAAAAFALEQRLTLATGVADLASALIAAAQAGLQSLEQTWLETIAQRIGTEASVGQLGAALERLTQLRHGEAVLGAHGASRLEEVLRALVSRLTWLLEGVTGATAAFDLALVKSVVALKHATHDEGIVDVPTVSAMMIRIARGTDVPSCLRGAALGFAWTAGEATLDEDDVVKLVRGAALPATFGDFLSGLFAVAQRVVPAMLAAIDAATTQMPRDEFFIALPALRQAFAFFSPPERLRLAETLIETLGEKGVDPMALLERGVASETVQLGHAADAKAFARAEKYGLLGGRDA
ncbi:MAG: DUF5682 family protein [Archangium sp.]